MRYDKEIIFVLKKDSRYDPDLGQYVPGIEETTSVMANVTEIGTDRSVAIFGELKEGQSVVRLLNHYNQEWDFIRFDEKTWKLVTDRKLRRKHTLIVEETVIANG